MLDEELIKMILKKARGDEGVEIALSEYPPEQVARNSKFLLDDRLIAGEARRGDNKLHSVYIREITPAGDRFLEAAENEKWWQGFKSEIRKRGPTIVAAAIKAAMNETLTNLIGGA